MKTFVRATALAMCAVPLAGLKAAAQAPSVRIAPTTLVSDSNASRQLTLPTPAPTAGIPLRPSSSAPAVAVFQASGSGTFSTTFPGGQTTLVAAPLSAVPAVTRPAAVRAHSV